MNSWYWDHRILNTTIYSLLSRGTYVMSCKSIIVAQLTLGLTVDSKVSDIAKDLSEISPAAVRISSRVSEIAPIAVLWKTSLWLVSSLCCLAKIFSAYGNKKISWVGWYVARSHWCTRALNAPAPFLGTKSVRKYLHGAPWLFHESLFIRFAVILRTNRQADRHTARPHGQKDR